METNEAMRLEQLLNLVESDKKKDAGLRELLNQREIMFE